jgi:hypothetical protein
METYKLLKFEFLMNSAACASSEESDECQTKKKQQNHRLLFLVLLAHFLFRLKLDKVKEAS